MGKIEEMQTILRELGLPKKQQNERTALIMLALAGLKEKSKWKQVTEDYMRPHDILEFVNSNYEMTYKENTRETFRKDSLKPLCDAAILENNGAITNSPKTKYRLTKETAILLKLYGTDQWADELEHFLETHQTLEELYEQKKVIDKSASIINGISIEFKRSPHNKLQKAILEEFSTRFAKGSKLLYVGDTAEKYLYINKKEIERLGIEVFDNAALPDVVLYHEQNNWVYFIEAVTSVGPMTAERVYKIKKSCEKCNAGLVFVTAFQNKKKCKEKILEIAWETEIWIADEPDHMIHLNGDRFMGPRDTDNI